MWSLLIFFFFVTIIKFQKLDNYKENNPFQFTVLEAQMFQTRWPPQFSFFCGPHGWWCHGTGNDHIRKVEGNCTSYFPVVGVKHQTKATDKRKCLFGLMVPGGQESVWAGKPGSQQQIWTEREAENSCPQTKAQRQEPTGSQVRLCTLKAPPVEGHAS